MSGATMIICKHGSGIVVREIAWNSDIDISEGFPNGDQMTLWEL